jgi:predicted nucleic acid-binding protein
VKNCMSAAKCFVDTNILIYAHDPSAGPKHERATKVITDLWQSRAGVLSTQVLQEFCVAVRRFDRSFPLEDLARIVQNFFGWEIIVNSGESILSALAMEARYQISFWDALIVNAAQIAHADVLYTEDLNDGQLFGSVRVVNPLKSS